jgi:hypothetical protein
MSLASSSSYSVAGSSIKQHGVLTFAAGQTKTVPCKSIVATDEVSLRVQQSTAGAAAYAAALTNHVFTITITPGTGFTVVGVDVLFAGQVEYIVHACSLPSVDIA